VPNRLKRSACKLLLAFVAGITLIPEVARAEEPPPLRVRRMFLEAGLSHPWVHCIHQDRNGFMWFGTMDGLNRYDGNEFRVFRPQRLEGEPDHFSVRTIHEDDQGMLWVGGINNGFSLFDPSVGKFSERYRFDAAKPNWLASQSVISIQGAADRKLWLGTDWGGLHRFDPKTKALEHFPLRDPSPQNTLQGTVQAIYYEASSPSEVWLGTATMGLIRLDLATGEIRRFIDDPPAGNLIAAPRAVTSIAVDSPGVLLLTASTGLYLFDCESGKFLNHFPYLDEDGKNRGLSSILKTRDGSWWVSSGTAGVGRFTSVSGEWEFQIHRYDASDPQSLSHNRVRSLYQDRGGMIWAAMSITGLCLFDPQGGWIREHQFEDGRSGHSDPFVLWAMLPDEAERQAVWLGTSDGLVRWNRSSGGVERFFDHQIPIPGRKNYGVLSLSRRAKGGIWIGSNHGLLLFDPDLKEVVRVEGQADGKKGLAGERVYSLHEDRDGILWAGRDRGVRRFNPETNEITAYYHDPANLDSIGAMRVTKIHEDRAGNLWFGHHANGISMLSKETGKFVRIVSNPYAPGSLSGLIIRSFYEDSDGGILWAGTNRGLMRIEIESGVVTEIAVSSLSADVFGIEQDQTGDLWLRTRNGIVRMLHRHSAEPKFQDTTGAVGLKLGGFAGVHCSLASGEILFPAPTGILEVHPDRFRLIDPPQVVLTDFQLLNQPAEFEGEKLTNKIVLKDAQNKVMKFKFTALDYAAPEHNRFAYRLEGFEREWQYDVADNSATYTTLKPGEYVFHVKAANSQGVWNETGTSIALTVLPPWWETSWFRILAIATFLGGWLTIIRVRTRSARQRTAKLEVEAVERETLNRKLRISEQRFRSFLTNSSEQVWCIEFDEPIPLDLSETEQAEWVLDNAYFAEANEMLAAAYGASVEELLTWRFEKVIPRSLPTTIPLLEEVARAGFRLVDFETDEVAKDGSARVMLNNLIGTIRDGKVIRVWGTTRDITDQRRAEQGILEKNEALETEVEKRTEAQDKLRDLASRLIHTQEHERRHVARELHDDLTQRLAAMVMDAQIAERDIENSPQRAREKLQEIQQELTEMATSTQELSRQLHPKILEELGLARAASAECRRFGKRVEVQVETQIDGEASEGLSAEESLCLYRILQEGLGNIAKHAKPDIVEVALTRSDDGIILSIEDDGVGFDLDSTRHGGSLGMVSMSERARLCGATFDIQSQSGKGTKITVSLPMKNKNGGEEN
jgi:signal transduction histidine kinase/ligand-binding sensor domain-containing protein